MPMLAASRTWLAMWRYSPCTGMKNSGWVTVISMASSPWRAWPLTWTFSTPEWMTSTPRRWRLSMTRPTDHSLPGDRVGADDDDVVLAGA